MTRAHGAGDRVVLTASCFDQSALDKMAGDPTTGPRLAASLVQLVTAKNLDGVNIDFEGKGSKDQAGLDTLVAAVSSAMHHANPHWQVTMDTYASSAGDPSGFYDIPGLNSERRRVLRDGLRHERPSTPSPTAPLTGAGFTDLDAVQQYAAVVSPSKVILGVPYYGYDWPTAGPGLGDPATGSTHTIELLAGGGDRGPRLLGPDDPDPVDLVPGGIAMAPDVLRQPDVVGAQGATGQHVPRRRGRHLGPGNGGCRPGHAGGAAGERPRREGSATGAGRERRHHHDHHGASELHLRRDVERGRGHAHPRRPRIAGGTASVPASGLSSPGSPPTTRTRLCLEAEPALPVVALVGLPGRLRRHDDPADRLRVRSVGVHSPHRIAGNGTTDDDDHLDHHTT